MAKAGRPTRGEQRQREREFLRLVAGGSTLSEAREQTGMNDATVLRLLDREDFFAVVAALRDGRLGSVAVTLEPVKAEAA